MPAPGPFRFLHRSESVTVADYRCHSHERGRGPEEVSDADSIVLMRRGVFMKHVRGDEVIADSASVLFFSRGEPYRVSHPAGCGDQCTIFTPSRDTLAELLAAHDPWSQDHPEAPFRLMHAPAASRGYLRHRVLFERLNAGPADDIAVGEVVFDVLDHVLEALAEAKATARRRQPERRATREAHRDLAAAARLALAQGHHERLTLAGLARLVHSSPYHLSRLFRRVTGMSIHQHLNRLRLREALDRLARGERDLTSIALACGFFDHSHFANAFRREFGITPSQCRDAMRRRDLRQMSRFFQVGA